MFRCSSVPRRSTASWPNSWAECAFLHWASPEPAHQKEMDDLRKLIIGALLSALALAGCGGSTSKLSSSSRSSTTTASVSVTTPIAPTTSTSTSTSTSASTSASTPATTSTPTASTETTQTSTSPSGGVAPNGAPSTTSAFTPTAEEVAKAKKALRGCQANQPGITLEQLEREAASAEGIQC